MKNNVVASAGSAAAGLAARCVALLLNLDGEFSMRPLLIVAAASLLLANSPALAQAGMATAMPSLGTTSSLGVAPSESIGPNGLPLVAAPAGSTAPHGV